MKVKQINKDFLYLCKALRASYVVSVIRDGIGSVQEVEQWLSIRLVFEHPYFTAYKSGKERYNFAKKFIMVQKGEKVLLEANNV